MRHEELEEIHNSSMNGQRRQMVEQIDEYGLYDFFDDYKKYLFEIYSPDKHTEYYYFADCVISYHRTKNK